MRKVPVLIPVLALAFLTFCGILVWAYVEAEKADPKMLDENGKVKQSGLLVPGPDLSPRLCASAFNPGPLA
jgi:hypothetical protein